MTTITPFLQPPSCLTRRAPPRPTADTQLPAQIWQMARLKTTDGMINPSNIAISDQFDDDRRGDCDWYCSRIAPSVDAGEVVFL